MITKDDVEKINTMSIEDLVAERNLAKEYIARIEEIYNRRIQVNDIPIKRLNEIVRRKYHYPPHCIMAGCEKSHGGARSSFFCAEHQSADPARKDLAKKEYRAETKRQ